MLMRLLVAILTFAFLLQPVSGLDNGREPRGASSEHCDSVVAQPCCCGPMVPRTSTCGCIEDAPANRSPLPVPQRTSHEISGSYWILQHGPGVLPIVAVSGDAVTIDFVSPLPLRAQQRRALLAVWLT